MHKLPEPLPGFDINIENEIDIDEFISHYPGFFLIATSSIRTECEYAGEDKALLKYTPIPGLEDTYKKRQEIVYIITFDKKVVKIGSSYTGMKKRHASYDCGTRKNMKIGTPSTTNYKISEFQYSALNKGIKIKWYMYIIPPTKAEINMWGSISTFTCMSLTFYETKLHEDYVKLTGHKPILAPNKGKNEENINIVKNQSTLLPF